MKKIAHLLIFLAAFQMEVRVRASESELTYPDNCLGKFVPCSFKVTTDKWSFEAGNVKLLAAADTILTSEDEKSKEWKLLEGKLWVKNGPSVKVRTLSAEAEGSSGQYWIFAGKDGKTLFRNINSKLVLSFKDQSKMEVPKGFQVWVGSVNSEAKVERGMVEPVDLKDHLKSWYSLYSGSREQFVSEVQDLKDQWADLVEQSGDIYKKVVERKLAALDDKKRQALELQQKKEKERRRIRAEFHKRVFDQ